MLIEFIKYILHYSSCPKYLRDLGVPHELISIESRYERCRAAWKEHLQKSKDFILKSIQEQIKQQETETLKTVLVFGSGHLLDLPLSKILPLTEKVILVDLIQAQRIKSKYQKHPKIELVEHDLSESLENNYNSINSYNPQSAVLGLQVNAATRFLDDQSIDLVISLNLLSQLHLYIENYLELKFSEFYSSKSCRNLLKNYKQNLIREHLLYLSHFFKQGSGVCLINDYIRTTSDDDSNITESLSSVGGINVHEELIQAIRSQCGTQETAINNVQEEWSWELAPLGEEHIDYKTTLQVQAIKV